MKIQPLFIVALLTCLFGSGCVTGRRAIDLPVPYLNSTGTGKGTLYIASVDDRRTFQNKPSDASTPSINGDVTRCSKEDLGMMIGRQRNTYGRAMGDITLPPGDSVLKRTHALVSEGLRRHGYTIASSPGSAGTATVTIDEFWAWFTPGMWSVSFQANIVCDITITRDGATKKISVKGYGRNQGQVASNLNWQLAYRRAFDDFLANLDTALGAAGL